MSEDLKIEEAKEELEAHLKEIRTPVNKHNRPRWPGARHGFPEPSVVVPHSGELNRSQRRSQGRYEGFLTKSLHARHTAAMLVRRSGSNRWTKREREKLVRLAERV